MDVLLKKKKNKNFAKIFFFTKIGLHDIARLIFILYCLDLIFKIIIDTIFIYSFRYHIKILVTRM